LVALESQELALTNELEQLTEKCHTITGQASSATDGDTTLLIDDSRTGSFFHQLRTVDASIERLTHEKSGVTAVVHSLKSEVASFAAKNRRHTHRITELRAQQATGAQQERSKQSDVSEKNLELHALTRERALLQNFCEETKAAILATVTDMQECSPDYIAKLVALKSSLEASLQEEKRKAEKLQKDARSRSLKSFADTTRRTKDLVRNMNPMEWQSERAGLLSRVKKARQELELLGSRERGQLKAAHNVHSKCDRMLWEPDEVKIAIALEINSFPSTPPQFLLDSMHTEQQYEKRLKRQLDEVNALEKSVGQFKRQYSELTAIDEENIEKAKRIQLLTEELHEMRGRL
jgi:chromosome segregation ATPase